MNIKQQRFLVWLLVGAALYALLFLVPMAQGQQVTINVSVMDESGEPIEGLVVSVFGDIDTWVEDVTDADGDVSLTLPRPLSYQSLVVGLLPPTLERQGMSTYREWEQRRVELLNQYAVDGLYSIPLVDGVSEYVLSITLFESVTIIGRVMVEGMPSRAGVFLLGALWGDMSERATGLFTIGGVRKGAATTLVFGKGYGQRELYWFSSTETLNDIDLGDVVLSPAESDSRLDLDITDWNLLDLRGRSRAPSVSLVRDDGSYSVSLKLDAEGRAQLIGALPADLWIPAGTYYVATGPEGPDPVANRLIRLVHEGVVDLDAAGVAKVTVIAGQVTTLQLSAPVVEAAVMNAGE